MLLWRSCIVPRWDGMSSRDIYALIHSPLVGPFTWRPVADQMRQSGLNVIVPALNDSPDSNEHFWKQHASSVSSAFTNVANDIPVIWVVHSGAGPLLPVLRRSIPNPAHAYVFVDAGIPRNAATRLDLMRSEDAAWAEQFKTFLDEGGRFPNWTMDDLKDIVPDEKLRHSLIAELHPRGLDFFTEPIPVFDGWPDAPCIYIQFSGAYNYDATQARQAGWPTYKVEAGHFHMLVDAATVSNMIVKAAAT